MWRAARLACAKKSPPFRDVFCFGFHHHCSKNGVLAHSKASWQWRHHPLDAKVVRRNSVVSVPFSAFLRAFSTAAEAVVSEDETAANASALEEEFRQITVQNGAHRRVNGIGEGRREINGINGHGFKENGGVLAEDEALNEALAVKQQEEAARIKERNKERALRARQMRIETQAWQRATKEYQELAEEMCASNLAPSLPYMKSLFLGWFEPLRDTIADEQKAQATRKGKTAYGDYLMQLPPDMLAVITMHKTVALLMTGRDGDCCARVVQAVVEIGEAVEHEAKVHRILERTRKKGKRAPKPEEQQEVQISKDQELLRQRIAKLMKKHKGREVRRLVQANAEAKSWGKELQAKVGSVLLELLIQTAFIQPPADQNMDGPPEIRPAFKHTFRSGTKEKAVGKGPPRRYGVIECDPLVKKGLERTARHMVIPYMPMLVKPLPWRGYDKGAYLFLPSYVMRIHGARKQRETMKNVPKRQMEQVYKVLDILGSTKWRVNKRVLNVVDRLWSEGGGIADLVSRNDVPYPEKPETEDVDELKRWRWRMRKVKKENSELYSQRCDVELKLSVARKMRDEKHFYYPHNVDFRGRAYPMHPYLNHLGSDMCRGLLEFAEGRKLGKAGLTWLKIHAASLFGSGVDKLSFDGRLAFVEDNIGEIFESAEHPLEGNRFWMQAEDPFQFLAICMNLYDALNSPNPEDFVCYTPVHQDGSCNGLQHYAALGRDKLGAEAVNLTCGNKPADVYSGIAARVLEIMQKDAVKDVSTFKNAVWAKALVGQVDRKLVKQTVMTSVYGVTYIGAREQIKKRLKERGIFAEETDLHNASCYCAKVTLTALGEMFKAARSIMSWLGDCAKIIAHENATVRWTTPLGLPVVQPYQKYTRKMVRTSLQVLALQSESNTVMAHRQRSAFPPNFVHSLDSSHMMMTALSCNEAGLTFAGVHDSYWTHAADVETMNRILREKFVELYKKPILEDLLQSFQTAFPNLGFPPLPDRGDFELEEVLNSPYFFN